MTPEITVTVFLTRAFSGPQAVIPESSLSPHSNLSVPSNPAQSTQLQSSYNPFEDEDDTGSSVSEKEDIKAKKLVNTHFPLWLPPCFLCLFSLSRGLLGSHPSALQQCMGPAGPGHIPDLLGQGQASPPLWEGTANTLGCFFSVLC